MQRIEAAWLIENKGKPVTPAMRKQYRLPDHVRAADEAARYLLFQASKVKTSNAYYNLMLFYLQRDCEKATFYARQHRDRFPSEPEAARPLDLIDQLGCDEAAVEIL